MKIKAKQQGNWDFLPLRSFYGSKAISPLMFSWGRPTVYFSQISDGCKCFMTSQLTYGADCICSNFFTNKPTQFVPGVGEFLLVWKENRGELFFFVVSHEKYYVNKQSFFNHRISTCLTFCIVRLANYLIIRSRCSRSRSEKNWLKKEPLENSPVSKHMLGLKWYLMNTQ